MEQYNLRKLQLFEADMLSEIADILEKNNITYYISSGTMLGAARHKGFIPWDDDIDMLMPIDDYKRFMKIGQELIGEKYFLQNFMTDKYYYRSYARIIANNTTMMTRPSAVKLKSHQGVWIDIFPLVEIGGEDDIRKKKKILDLCNVLQRDDMINNFYDDIVKQYGTKIAKLVKLIHILPLKVRQRLHILLLNKIFNCKNRENICGVWRTISHHYPKSLFASPSEKVEFEGRMYNAVPNYEKYLSELYGKNYMQIPPVEQQKGHYMYKVDLKHNYTDYLEQ